LCLGILLYTVNRKNVAPNILTNFKYSFTSEISTLNWFSTRLLQACVNRTSLNLYKFVVSALTSLLNGMLHYQLTELRAAYRRFSGWGYRTMSVKFHHDRPDCQFAMATKFETEGPNRLLIIGTPYMLTQNFVRQCATVHELSCAQRKKTRTKTILSVATGADSSNELQNMHSTI